MMKNCCSNFKTDSIGKEKFELVKIEKTENICPMCENFAKEQIEKKTPVAVLSCEGACLRGEIARQVANQICFKLKPENTARICLGGLLQKTQDNAI
jgi:hypothetical protein